MANGLIFWIFMILKFFLVCFNIFLFQILKKYINFFFKFYLNIYFFLILYFLINYSMFTLINLY